MFHIVEYGAQLLCHIALADERLSLGVLMDPAEVQRTARAHHCNADSGRWWLCGNMHRRMFEAAQTLPLRHLGKVIVTGQGTRYIILAQQVGAWQHRILLQVAGRQVLDFLAAGAQAGFDLSLGLAGGDESLLVQDCKFVPSLVGEADERGDAVAEKMSPHKLREEACLLAASLLSPAEVTVEELPMPRHVCVTIVASSELVDAVMKPDTHSH